MCLSSDSTFGINAKGIIRAAVKQWGLLRVLVLSCPVGLSRIHVLPNTSRILSTFTTSHMLCATHRRSKLEELLEFLRTNTRKWYFIVLMRSLQPPSWLVSLGFAMTVLLTKKSILSNLCCFQVLKLQVFDLFPLEFRIPTHINCLHSVSSDYSWRFSPRYLLPLVPWRKLKSLSRCSRPQPWTSLLSWIE